jgi:hypothetical protein
MQFWIDKARVIQRPMGPNEEAVSDRYLLQTRELVRVETDPAGTEICWVMFAANWASLMFVREWIAILNGPFVLKFFNLGWFEERCATLAEAQSRIDQLIAKSDIRFSSRVFTRDAELRRRSMLPELAEAFESGSVDENKAVVCLIDFETERTEVAHVGRNSALASVWGDAPSSYPRQSGHSYDRVVSRPYFEVASSGRPHHDHVLAAMTQPDGDVRWFGYQRLILPNAKRVNGLPTVSIVCQGGPVDIRIV